MNNATAKWCFFSYRCKYPAGHYFLKSFSMLSVYSRLHNFLLIWMHPSSISLFRDHLRGQMKYLYHPLQRQGDWLNHLLPNPFLTGDPAGRGSHLHGARVWTPALECLRVLSKVIQMTPMGLKLGLVLTALQGKVQIQCTKLQYKRR